MMKFTYICTISLDSEIYFLEVHGKLILVLSQRAMFLESAKETVIYLKFF